MLCRIDTALPPKQVRRLFDAKRFLIDNFRTPAELMAFVRHYGFDPPSDEAVFKWFRRETVPAPWGYVLIGLLELDRGRPVSIAQYLRGGA